MKALRVLSPFLAFALVYFGLGLLDHTQLIDKVEIIGYTHQQRMIGGIFAATVALWITEMLPLAVTGLVGMCLLVLFGGFKEKEVFTAFGDQIVPLFIGSFILAKGMEVSGISDRFAYFILSKRWASGSASRLLFSLGWISCLISLFVSNTATTAMLMPIGVSMLAALGVADKGSKYGTAVMLMLTWGSSVAVGFPIGTPPNLIGLTNIETATGHRISFIEWMGFAMPITIVMTFFCWLVLWRMFGKEAPHTEDAIGAAREKLKTFGRFTVRERNVMIAFVVAVLLWTVPDLMAMAFGPKFQFAKDLQAALPPSVAALMAAALLFLLPTGQGPTLSWQEAVKIDWGIILVFGAGVALGQAMFSTGLAAGLGRAAATAAGADSVWAITFLAVVISVLLSEIASNTAAATVLVPVAIGLAQGAGVSPIPPVLGVALGASLGFMLPISTGPNAIVYSTGLIPGRQMIKTGAVIDVIGIVVTFGCLYIFLPMLGLVR